MLRVVLLILLSGLLGLSSCRKTVVKRDFFHLSYPTALTTTHPILATDLTAYNFLHNIHEGIMSYGLGGEVVYGLAQRIEISDDGLVYDIYLRPNLQFSDASSLNSHDVLASWLYALDSTTLAPFAHLYDYILGAREYRLGHTQQFTGVRIINDEQLQVELVRPFFFFKELLANPSFAVIAPAWREGQEQWQATSGAYQIIQRRADGGLELKANVHHHAYDPQMLHVVVVSFIGNGELAYQLFKAGELDWQLKNVPIRTVLQDKQDGVLNQSEANGSYFILFNHQRAPYDDLRVRKALSLAVDRDELVSLLDERPKANSYLTPFDFSRKQASADVALAQELISLVGYTPELPLVVNYRYSGSAMDRSIASYLYEAWQQLTGVEVKLELIEPARYRSLWTRGDFELIRVSWFVGDYEDSGEFLQNFTSQASFMRTGFYDEYFEQLLEQADQVDRLIERQNILDQAESYLLDEAYAVLTLFAPSTYHLVDFGLWDGIVMSQRDIHPLRLIRSKLG